MPNIIGGGGGARPRLAARPFLPGLFTRPNGSVENNPRVLQGVVNFQKPPDQD